MRISRTVYAAIAATVIATSANAESKPLMIGGGYICDTLDQIIELIETKATKQIEGCGRLQGRFPATVTPVVEYKAHGLNFNLAQYDFVVPVPWGVQRQYGYFGKPTAIKAQLEHRI